ncbi:MAG: hypothetical protein ACK56I_05875 [bacterium]
MNPHLVCLPEAVYPPHLALLVRVGEDAHGGLLPRDGEDKVLPALLGNVLPQLTQQTAGPLLLHLQLLCYQLLLTKKQQFSQLHHNSSKYITDCVITLRV